MDFLNEPVSMSYLEREVSERKRKISKFVDRIGDIEKFLMKCMYMPKPNAGKMMRVMMESRMLDTRINLLWKEIDTIREKMAEEDNSSDTDNSDGEDNSSDTEDSDGEEREKAHSTQQDTLCNDEEETELFDDLGPEPDIEDLLPELGGCDI